MKTYGEPQNHRIHIWSDGDPSVGINGDNASVVLENFYIEDEDHKKEIRVAISCAFQQIFDDYLVKVAFDEDLNEVE